MKNIIIGIIIGGMIFTLGGVVAATTISSKNVTYQNKTVNTALDELYNEAITGKELVAEAITNKGVATTSSDTYEVMANNINSIDNNHNVDDKIYLYKHGDTSFRDIVSNVSQGGNNTFSFTKDYLKIFTYGNGSVSFSVDVSDINYIYFDFISNGGGRGVSVNGKSLGYFTHNIIDVSNYTGLISLSFYGNGQTSVCRNIYGVKELT